jgi:hypothetical protein
MERCAGSPAAARRRRARLVKGSAERVMDALRTLLPLAGWRRTTVEAFLALADPEEQLASWWRRLNLLRRAGSAVP